MGELTGSENRVDIASVDNLKTLIRNIAKVNASEIERNKSKTNEPADLKVEEIAAQVISFDVFEALDTVAATALIKSLNENIQVILGKDVLVRNQGIGKLVPLLYEVLSLIFAQTDEQVRKNHLNDLLEFYFSELEVNLESAGSDYILKRAVFNFQVKYLLVFVKFQILLEALQDQDAKNQKRVIELVKNLQNYFSFPKINQEDVYTVVRNKVGSNNYELVSYELIPLDAKNGHLGEYFQLKIDITQNAESERLDVFAKLININHSLLKEVLERGPSKKEEFFYMVLLPKMRQLGMGELLDFAPNCYLSRVDDILVLDDLTLAGFVCLTPNIKLDYSALKVATRQFAKLHACSLIMEEILSKQAGKRVTLYDLYSEYLQEVLFLPDVPDMKRGFQGATNNIVYIGTKFPEIAGKYTSEELKKKVQKGWDLAVERIKASKKVKNVICHGDVHVANMLFNLGANNECESVKLIDFQLLRYCPPTHDLMFFLYQNTVKSTLDQYKPELIEEYYNVLSGSLEKFNLTVNELYPREEFEESLKLLKVQAIFHAFLYSPMQSLDPKLREKLFSDPKSFEKLKENRFGLIDIGLELESYRE
uniref:CHK kinase-like domain-containing protein n=2 Tax=Dendroctonus ponderosae TaxID=77166 RepID=A0AAR5PMN0_DENPD